MAQQGAKENGYNVGKESIAVHFEHLDLDTNLPNNFRLKSPALGSPHGRRATEFPAPEQGILPTGRPKPIRRPRILTEAVSEPLTVPGLSPDSARHYYASPICLYCTGNCRKDPIFTRRNAPTPDVVCLSSSKDSQLTWVRDGSTMTQFLIKMLREQPKRKLKDILTLVR
ncbi:hypothetical protein CVT25_012418 [Psilocybe cyanescens]|uniref:Uncharacterized protein n=1 Tax=Psilocybe cyanescens TaxID=93625 RepID=A0A409X7K9_PSICY|nr:hypothetical protein CVT25_012418 [Psilocybe cyanescens]